MKQISRIFFVILGVLCSKSLSAQDFFYKDDGGKVIRTSLPLYFSAEGNLKADKIEDFKTFSRLTPNSKGGLIEQREATEEEKIVDGGFAVLTSTLVLASHSSYDITPDLRLSTIRGVLFFILPFESHFLYRKCANLNSSNPSSSTEYLVGQSMAPQKDRVAELKSIKEIDDICGHEEITKS